jgi:Rap/ran-GAP
VHIIWNEHYREYKWDTIGGDFGNAQIAVTPLQNGLFSISIYRDPAVAPFGPLHHRAVVTKSLLGPLVRATAINANRAALFASQNQLKSEPHPFAMRKDTLSVITHRHKTSTFTFEKFLDLLFTNGKDNGVHAASSGVVGSASTTHIQQQAAE